MGRCETLFSWKASYEEINQELAAAERKKQTLHELFKEGKISSSTYEYVSKTINDIIEKIKARQIELKERMAERAVELEKEIKSSERLLAKLKSSCASLDENEKEKVHNYETQLSAFTSRLDAMKRESTFVNEFQCKPAKPVSPPVNITEAPEIEKPIKVQTLITPLLKEKKIKEVTEKPKLETAKKPMLIPPVPKIVKQPPAKKVTVKPTVKRKRKPKAKKRLKRKPQIKKSLAERPRSRNTSRGQCRNPWNGECKNTDIEVTIYYKKELLPICRSCWNEIAEKDITW